MLVQHDFFNDCFEFSEKKSEVCSASTRGHPYKLFKPFSGCTSKSSFFSMTVINVWNDLPTDVVNFRTLESFKRTIQSVDFSNYL